MRSFIRLFSSVKLAIILFIILAAASVLGTLIPQGRSLDEYAARYGALSPVLVRLQFVRLYGSFWYLALLALFGLNLLVCTLQRLGSKLRRAFRPQVASDPKGLQSLRVKDKFKKGGETAEVLASLDASLRSARYRVRSVSESSRTHLLARKRVLGLFGADIVHAGLLVILAGGILTGIAGFRTEVALSEGQEKDVPGAGFSVRLDKFATELYPDGSVRDWKSTVTVIHRGRPVLTRTIEVNHPLTHRGFSLFQMSYGHDWESAVLEIVVKKKDDPSFTRTMKLKTGERVQLGDPGQTEIGVRRFLPDFVLGEGNEPQTRSLQPNNPAALVEGWQGGAKVSEGWVFSNYPDFGAMHGAKDAGLSFELKSVAAGQYSVLEAAKDPGVWFIWVGCALVMAGLGLAFYWPTWEVRAVLEDVLGKTEISAGGIAAKSRERFAAEFERVLAPLRRGK